MTAPIATDLPINYSAVEPVDYQNRNGEQNYDDNLNMLVLLLPDSQVVISEDGDKRKQLHGTWLLYQSEFFRLRILPAQPLIGDKIVRAAPPANDGSTWTIESVGFLNDDSTYFVQAQTDIGFV